MTPAQKKAVQKVGKAANPANLLDLRDPKGQLDNNKLMLVYVYAAITVAQLSGKPFAEAVAVAMIVGATSARAVSLYVRKKFGAA